MRAESPTATEGYADMTKIPAGAATRAVRAAATTASAPVAESAAARVASQSKTQLLAELQALSAARAVQPRPSMTGPPIEQLISKDRAMAKHLGVSVDVVRQAIHEVKDAGRFAGSRSNADVFLHRETGDLYPMISKREAGPDAIGNVHDWISRLS